MPRVDPKNADTVYSASIVTWRSTDGGKTWLATGGAGVLAQGVVMSISCPEATQCWTTGVMGPTGTPDEVGAIDLHTAPGFATSTSDGGKSWQQAQLPQGVGAILGISCPDATSCYAVGLKQVPQSSDTPQPFVLLAYGNAP